MFSINLCISKWQFRLSLGIDSKNECTAQNLTMSKNATVAEIKLKMRKILCSDEKSSIPASLSPWFVIFELLYCSAIMAVLNLWCCSHRHEGFIRWVLLCIFCLDLTAYFHVPFMLSQFNFIPTFVYSSNLSITQYLADSLYCFPLSPLQLIIKRTPGLVVVPSALVTILHLNERKYWMARFNCLN